MPVAFPALRGLTWGRIDAIRRDVVVVLLAAIVVIAAAIVLSSGGRGSTPGDAAAPQPSAAADSADPAPSGTGAPGTPGSADGEPAESDASSAAPTQGPTRAGSHDDGASVLEVPEDTATGSSALPGLAREEGRRRASEAELRQSFPALQVRTGALTPRHPRSSIPVPGAADVRSSSITTSDGVTQVGLVTRTTRSTAWALKFYRVRLGRIGFEEVEAPVVATGDAASFRRGADRVVVVTQTGEGTLVTLHAMLRTGG